VHFSALIMCRTCGRSVAHQPLHSPRFPGRRTVAAHRLHSCPNRHPQQPAQRAQTLAAGPPKTTPLATGPRPFSRPQARALGIWRHAAGPLGGDRRTDGSCQGGGWRDDASSCCPCCQHRPAPEEQQSARPPHPVFDCPRPAIGGYALPRRPRPPQPAGAYHPRYACFESHPWRRAKFLSKPHRRPAGPASHAACGSGQRRGRQSRRRGTSCDNEGAVGG
jgi:hypothetical protein